MKEFGALTSRGQVRRLRALGFGALSLWPLRQPRLRFIAHGENTTFRVATAGARPRGKVSAPFVPGLYLLRVHRADGATSPDAGLFRLFGPTCDSMDSMPGPYELPSDIREGDYIEIGMLGAYGVSKGTRLHTSAGGSEKPAAVPKRPS